MYDHVLVPTDGSERALAALEHATSLANQYDATLHTIHVVQATGIADALDGDQFENVIERIEDAGENAVEAVIEEARAADVTDVESSVVRGIPAEEIVQYVEQEEIDVVVMATAGRTRDEREVVGSVTERVIRTSPAPVFSVREER